LEEKHPADGLFFSGFRLLAIYQNQNHPFRGRSKKKDALPYKTPSTIRKSHYIGRQSISTTKSGGG
jgi:hypothetical protein